MQSLKKALLTEETNAYNVVLDLAGLIPGVGEFADAVNALDYAKKGEYDMAALSLISMIPEIGDVVGKGGKMAMWTQKTFPKMYRNVVTHGPEVVKAVTDLKALVKKHGPVIDKMLGTIEKQEGFKDMRPHVPKIRQAIKILGNNVKDENVSTQQDTQISESASYDRWQTLAGL